jgi:hypothetical protein
LPWREVVYRILADKVNRLMMDDLIRPERLHVDLANTSTQREQVSLMHTLACALCLYSGKFSTVAFLKASLNNSTTIVFRYSCVVTWGRVTARFL